MPIYNPADRLRIVPNILTNRVDGVNRLLMFVPFNYALISGMPPPVAAGWMYNTIKHDTTDRLTPIEQNAIMADW